MTCAMSHCRRVVPGTHVTRMEGDAAAVAATSSQVKQGEALRPTSLGSGSGKTTVGKENRSSGVLLPGQLALGCPAPMDGLLVFPQQLWGDEEDGGGSLLCASAGTGGLSDAGVAAVASAPQDTTFNQQIRPEELLLVAPLPTASCRRRWILCGRTVMATLKFVWSTATVTATLVAALLATLIFFWALSPVCTSCVRSSRRSNSAALATATAAVESGWSTLHINQLQVSPGYGVGPRSLLTLRARRTHQT